MRRSLFPQRRQRRRHIALLIETSNVYARGLLEGVVKFMREHGAWSFNMTEQARGEGPPDWFARWDGDGIIARIETPKIARAVCRLKIPTVDVSAARLVPSLPSIATDDAAVVRLGLEVLTKREFTDLAYCGVARFKWSARRQFHFREMATKMGHSVYCYDPPKDSMDINAQDEHLRRWIEQLPKPVGIMAAYDPRGQQVLAACRRARISVPSEVAVLGVDNDTLLCEFSPPPLSSIILNSPRAGYEAAVMLERMMAGEKVPAQAHLIPPLGVVERQSTDVLAVDDRDVARAMQFIRDHACEGINVDDVLHVVPLSRRVLEQRFHDLLGLTPHQEILQIRLNRVKQLLVETDLPLYSIAERAGFEHIEYLSVVFKRETGKTARQWRLQGKAKPFFG